MGKKKSKQTAVQWKMYQDRFRLWCTDKDWNVQIFSARGEVGGTPPVVVTVVNTVVTTERSPPSPP